MKESTLFNQRVSNTEYEELLKFCKQRVRQKKKTIIVVINLYIFRLIETNLYLKKVHAQAQLVCCDGVPIKWLSQWFSAQPIEKRVSGTEVADLVLKNFKNIFVIAANQQILDAAMSKYSSISAGMVAPVGADWYKKVSPAMIKRINAAKPQVILVGISPPKQEIWLHNNLPKTTASLGLCIGSAFEILTNQKSRAPYFIQENGLEWLWRLMQEPQRLGGRYVQDGIFFLKKIVQGITYSSID